MTTAIARMDSKAPTANGLASTIDAHLALDNDHREYGMYLYADELRLISRALHALVALETNKGGNSADQSSGSPRLAPEGHSDDPAEAATKLVSTRKLTGPVFDALAGGALEGNG